MSLIAITISCMALIITLGIVFSQVLTKQPAMRVVDMAKLLNQQALSLAKVHANGNVPQGVMQQAVEHLKHQLAAYALEHKVILLAKGAVLSGNLQDVTQEIEASIGDFQNQSPRIKP